MIKLSLRQFKILLLSGLILLISSKIKGQDIKWSLAPSFGIDMGGAIPFPLSDWPKGAKGTPKLYPNIGLGYQYVFNEKWTVGVEVGYHLLAFSAFADVRSQPFYFDDPNTVLYFSGETKTNVELRFVEFPVYAAISLNHNWKLEFGGYYSRILEGSFQTEGKNGVLSDNKTITDTTSLPGVANTSYNFNDYLDNYDAGILFGYRFRVNQKLFFWGRLHIGFKSIFIKEFENIKYELYQVRLAAGLSYNLFTGTKE